MDDIAVDYDSTGYLYRHLGTSRNEYDAMIVIGMVTRSLIIRDNSPPLFKLHSTVLFRRLQHLELTCTHDRKVLILPYLEDIKRLEIRFGIIPEYSLSFDLPLTHTLHWMKLHHSTSSWMLGRRFKALHELQIDGSSFALKSLSRQERLQVDLPACTTLQVENCPMDYLCFLSCSNVQILRWWQRSPWTASDFPALNSLYDFLCTLSCLQELYISIYPHPGPDPFIQFAFCDAQEQGVWRDIRDVEVKVWFTVSSLNSDYHRSFTHMLRNQPHAEKWWNQFTVTKNDWEMRIIVRASM